MKKEIPSVSFVSIITETQQHNNNNNNNNNNKDKSEQPVLITTYESDDEDEIIEAFSNSRINLLSGSTPHINIHTNTYTTTNNANTTTTTTTTNTSNNSVTHNVNAANSSFPPSLTNLFSQINITPPFIFERRSILKKEPSPLNFLAQSTQNLPFPKDRKTPPEFEFKLTRSQDSVFEKRISWGSDILQGKLQMSTTPNSSVLLHDTKSKCDVELKKFLNYIANQLSEQEPVTRETYYKPLQPLISYAKEMIALSVEEIRGGKCKEIVTKIILHYKNDGALEFYDKQLVTKLLLIISRVSRLVEHLELEEGHSEGQGILNGATVDDEDDLSIIDNTDEENLLPMQSIKIGSSGSTAISPRRSGDIGTPPTNVKKIKGIIAFLVAKVKKWKKDKRVRSDSKSSKDLSSSARDISVYSTMGSNDSFVDDADYDLRAAPRSRGHSRNISEQYGSSFTGKSRRKSLIADSKQFFDTISTKLSNILEQPLSIGTPGRQSSLSSASNVPSLLCRICEEMVPANELEDHTKDCAIETQADIRVSNCDYRLDRISKVFASRIRIHKEDSTKWKVVESFESLFSITRRAMEISIGTNFSVESIRDLISECHQFIHEPSDLHTTLAKKLLTLLNQKLTIMEDLKSKGYHRPKKAKRHGINDFNIIKPISKGAFGRVYLAKKKQTGDIYALKVLNKKQTLHKKQVAHITAERNILAATHNPFLVKLYYSFQTRSSLCLVLEYLPGGDLYSLLRALGCFQEEMAKQYIAEVVLALEYLHSLNIVHRDLKPDNLLVDAFGHIKLTDFGLSRYGLLGDDHDYSYFESMQTHGNPSQSLSSPSMTLFISSPTSQFISSSNNAFGGSGGSDTGSKSSNSGGILNSVSWKKAGHVKRYSFVGTPDYLAPEVILGTGHSKQVDWWALGVILFEFITGVPPFNAETPNLVFENIIQRSITWPEIPEGMSHDAYDLISKLLCVDPNQRLGSKGAQEVKSHHFFSGINWDTLLQQSPSFVPHTSDPHDTSYFDEARQVQMSSCSFKSVSGEFMEAANDLEEENEGDGVFIGFSYRDLPNLEALTKQALQSSPVDLSRKY